MTIKRFNEMGEYPGNDIPTPSNGYERWVELNKHTEWYSSDDKYSELPEWVWSESDDIETQSGRWREVDELLNRGGDYPDLEYWSNGKMDEYHTLKNELDQLSRKLTRSAQIISDKLVKWRDENFISLDYDQDEGKSYEENEPIYNAVAYMCMSLRNHDWYQERYSGSDKEIESGEKRRKEISDQIMKKLKADGY